MTGLDAVSVFFGLLLMGAAGSDGKAQSSGVPDIGTRRELFVDHFLIDRLTNATLKLHEPRPAEIVMKADRPWEGEFNYPSIVLKDGTVYRMYYRGWPSTGTMVRCYAESADGIHWTKPDLGIHEVAGTKKNNVILVEFPFCNNFAPFIDTRPGVSAAERYKALAGQKGLVAYASADGIHWRKLRAEPVFRSTLPNAFDGYCQAFWSDSEGLYACYFRCAVEGIRAVARTTSKDFIHWTEPVVMTYSDTKTTRPSQHLYEHMTDVYYRAPHIYVAFPARFMEGRRVVTDAELKTLSMATLGGHQYYGDCSDGAFMTSRGGARFDRTFPEAFIRPGPGAENWVSRTNYPIRGVVPTGPNEMSIYVNRHYAQKSWHVRRYALRTDGFSSVNAGSAGGEMITRPFTFAGKELEINYATSAAGGIRVELQDVGGNPIPGLAAADCPEIVGDRIEHVVAWKGGSNVGTLAGNPVRVRFMLRDADIYSIRFR